jgi:hypothetical protein
VWRKAVNPGYVLRVVAREKAPNTFFRRISYVLTLHCNTQDFSRYGAAHLSLDHDCVSFGWDQFDHFDSKRWDGTRKRTPNDVNAAANRHNAVRTVWRISS